MLLLSVLELARSSRQQQESAEEEKKNSFVSFLRFLVFLLVSSFLVDYTNNNFGSVQRDKTGGIKKSEDVVDEKGGRRLITGLELEEEKQKKKP